MALKLFSVSSSSSISLSTLFPFPFCNRFFGASSSSSSEESITPFLTRADGAIGFSTGFRSGLGEGLALVLDLGGASSDSESESDRSAPVDLRFVPRCEKWLAVVYFGE